MSIYKELDTIISDYVGYQENEIEQNYDCADINLYNKLIDECSEHLNGKKLLENMSEDAQICIKNWEELLRSYTTYQREKANG